MDIEKKKEKESISPGEHSLAILTRSGVHADVLVAVQDARRLALLFFLDIFETLLGLHLFPALV